MEWPLHNVHYADNKIIVHGHGLMRQGPGLFPRKAHLMDLKGLLLHNKKTKNTMVTSVENLVLEVLRSTICKKVIEIPIIYMYLYHQHSNQRQFFQPQPSHHHHTQR